MPQYYPKSQIQTNLYTPGTEYQTLLPKKPYKGYYYCISNGSKYTGRFPGDGENIELKPIFNNDPQLPTQPTISQQQTEQIVSDLEKYDDPYTDFDSGRYIKLKNEKNNPKFIPSPSITLPTIKDKRIGVFNRFFCKKNNENIYFEINGETYIQLKNKESNIAHKLYTSTSLEWTLSSSSMEKLFLINRNSVVLTQINLRWFGFLESFNNDFLKYSNFI
jgi:hypothetical protein